MPCQHPHCALRLCRDLGMGNLSSNYVCYYLQVLQVYLPRLLHLVGSRDRSSPHVNAEVALRNVSKIKQEPDTARPARTRDHLIAQNCLAYYGLYRRDTDPVLIGRRQHTMHTYLLTSWCVLLTSRTAGALTAFPGGGRVVSSYVSRGMSPHSGERRSFCSKRTGCNFSFLILSINPTQGTEERKF